ncbi:uncharacterized protein PAC_06201 [Phialocephala subalpina]|uniref:Fungal N-terminal domain-containing protein n=1 Tax=Phialocephala subalpina TaxID=576137 RepID=A0A1L7WUA6_9HELO|nr:uncharacterized protein PAC_06201 [Phialocephala subalpina]
MAEVLGIVASGIAVGQLASEVTSSIITLKGYWDQVKEATSEIRQLLLELDSLNLILRHIQNDQHRENVPTLGSTKICVDQTWKLCKEGSDELNGLVGELAEKIDRKTGWRKKAGAAKVVLKKEEMKLIKRRMKNAIRLLSLAHQCHTNAMIQLQPDIIVARLSHTINSTTSIFPHDRNATLEWLNSASIVPETQSKTGAGNGTVETSPVDILVRRQYQHWGKSLSRVQFLIGSLQYWSKYETPRGRQRLTMTTKYQCPTWLSERAWDVTAIYQSHRGWRFYLRSYRELPNNHEIFKFVRNGDIASLKHMLATGQGYITAK